MITKRIVILAASVAFLAASTSVVPAAAADDALPDALPDALEAGWKGEKVCERLHEDEHIRVLKCTFGPDQGHERHFHPAYFGYVMSGGQMRLTDASGTRDVTITTGQTIEGDGVPWHQAENIGDTSQSYIMIEKKY